LLTKSMADFRTVVAAGTAEPAARRPLPEEDFPRSARLLPPRLRPHVTAFYDFVRLADSIADDPDLEREVKLAHLDSLERALLKGEGSAVWLRPAVRLHASLAETGIPPVHARQVIHAYRRDARNLPCQGWADLIAYCRYGAAPIGRYLLALHGEDETATGASDALCSALRILTHLRTCRDDWVLLGRCYLPLAWFEEARTSPERLVERSSDPRLRAIFDRTLDRVDELLDRAAALPGLVRHRRLRLETAVLLSHAAALAGRLRHRDPLARRVSLSFVGRAGALLRGLRLALGPAAPQS
jgi:phytoene/squalene synthetase